MATKKQKKIYKPVFDKFKTFLAAAEKTTGDQAEQLEEAFINYMAAHFDQLSTHVDFEESFLEKLVLSTQKGDPELSGLSTEEATAKLIEQELRRRFAADLLGIHSHLGKFSSRKMSHDESRVQFTFSMFILKP